MATRKMKRFAEGGIDELEAANASELSQDIAREAESAGAEATGSAILDKMRDDANKKSVAKPTSKSAAKATVKAASSAEEKTNPAVKKSTYETPYDRMNRQNRESAAKTTSKEERKPLPLRGTKSEGGNRFMGSGYKAGGSVSASSRADGIAQRGKTRGKVC